jgi:hypothetical protein
VGKVVQPLKSVNYHDSRAHGHERHGPFTQLVGEWFGWFWLGLLWSSLFGSWYAAGAKPKCMVLGSGYRGETYELCSVLVTMVRLVSSVQFWL